MCCPSCKSQDQNQIKLNKSLKQKMNPLSEKYLCLNCFNLYLYLINFKFFNKNLNFTKILN